MAMELKEPEIRFDGFSGEWKKATLASLCSNFRSGKFIRSEDINKDGAYPVYGGNGLRGYTSEYNHEGSYALIGRQGALCGNMNFSNGKAFFTEHAIAVQANEKNDTLFLYYKLGSMNLGQYSGQSAQPGLSVNKLSELETFTAGKVEQTAIGNYFHKLDTLINQHQQKHDKLSNLKKAMLEKMFPKAGETVPEVRFDGFTGNWTTTSLSKIAHVIDPHPSHRAPDAVANGVPFIGIGDVDENGHVDFKNVRIVPYHIYGEHRQRYQVEVGDFAYGRVASIGKIIDLSSNVDREYTYSPTMAIVKPVTLYSPYLKGYMNTSVFKGRVDNKTTGSTRKSLGVQDFRELSVCFPEQQEEQIKIGDYFLKLGLLINQHNQQITKLKNIKQACLDKMFV
ncbi:restriction endonuclease subunit S [Neptuniibacter caesariensis]|uniref:Putative type I restriction enzyme, S subunit n=1 Tax=Neptuniibacter caesariensis TaxID=207954 RepID=A0A7U8C5D6_NEPCE|nr:restriction endonuclease subunit S [Neptuniibacter caesariensis]EAR61890.1 putative type I restriction enzyme, S subunit [Oceanospirillum sp. MED92] [Neptuniibacter caesariensis]